eukprot:12521767-Heterocapsa_arctica.AAC.1
MQRRRKRSQALKAGAARGASARSALHVRHDDARRVGPDRSCRASCSARGPESVAACHLALERAT